MANMRLLALEEGNGGTMGETSKHDYNLRLLTPFLAHALLFQIVTGLTRITTSYRAIELDVSYVW